MKGSTGASMGGIERNPGQVKRPTAKQLRYLDSLRGQLGLRDTVWPETRSEAARQIDSVKKRLAKRESIAERKRHPDQWGLPAAPSQLFLLEQCGLVEGKDFNQPLTRREAQDLYDAERTKPGSPARGQATGG